MSTILSTSCFLPIITVWIIFHWFHLQMLSVQVLSCFELIEVQSLVFCDIIERGIKLYQFLPLYFVVISNWLFIPFNNVQFSLWVTVKVIKGVGSFGLWWWCVWAQSDARDSVSSLCCHWLDISQQQALVSDLYSVYVDLSEADVGENYKICWDCFLRYFLRWFLWYLDAWNVFRRSKKENINGWTLI